MFLGAHLLVIFGLYYKISSDMGSGLVFVFIFICMCFASGVAARWFVIGGVGAALAFYILWEEDVIKDYMKDRFIVVFDHSYQPLNVGWHQTRSLMTLGGGKLTGMGLFHGIQTQSKESASLPNRHTDFIFSIFASNFGLLGASFLIFCICLFDFGLIYLASKCNNKSHRYIIIGFITMILYQQIQNIGMNIGLLPITGITLPFISYGGSSLISYMIGIALVLNYDRDYAN